MPLWPDDVIYDNGRPPNYYHGFEMTGFIEADDFTLSTDAALTGVFFWDLEDPNGLGYQGEIDWILYVDAGGKPGAVLATGASRGGQVTRTFLQSGVNGIYDQYSNSLSIPPGVTLNAGTTYWLGLHNGSLTFTSWADFFWQTTIRNPTFYSLYDEAPFFDNIWGENFGQQQAFYLSGTIGPLFVERAFSEKNGWDINLLSDGTGIEDRSGGPNNDYALYLRFNSTLASVGGAVTSCGSIASLGVDPDDSSQVKVDLTGVDCDASYITVTVTGVVDTVGNTLDSASTTFGLLVGDVNGDGTVNRVDYEIIQGHEGQATNSHNYRADVSAKAAGIGHIDVSDANLVRHEQGTHLPQGSRQTVGAEMAKGPPFGH